MGVLIWSRLDRDDETCLPAEKVCVARITRPNYLGAGIDRYRPSAVKPDASRCQLSRCLDDVHRQLGHSPLASLFSLWHICKLHSLLGTRPRDVVLNILDRPGISCSDIEPGGPQAVGRVESSCSARNTVSSHAWRRQAIRIVHRDGAPLRPWGKETRRPTLVGVKR